MTEVVPSFSWSIPKIQVIDSCGTPFGLLTAHRWSITDNGWWSGVSSNQKGKRLKL